MKNKYWIIAAGCLLIIVGGIWLFKQYNFNPQHKAGDEIDSFNGVKVYYNGGVNNVSGRNLADSGYNLGLKYQCVEFVKRYYYEHLKHEMPDSYGHAKDFYNESIGDGMINKQRNLIQYSNPGKSKPAVNDLVVFSGTLGNRYGHVAIISRVEDSEIEIIQQNPGPYSKSRITLPLILDEGKWSIENSRVMGWLRKE